MQLLLDTHALLWFLSGDDALSDAARRAIEDADNAVSSAQHQRGIATKHRIGKLPGVAAIVADLDRAITDHGFTGLPIQLRHGQVAGALPGPHRDPFDRMLMAQSMLEHLILISNEHVFDGYGIERLW